VLLAETFRRDGDADANWEAPSSPIVTMQPARAVGVAVNGKTVDRLVDFRAAFLGSW
jgi:hypothetical protein